MGGPQLGAKDRFSAHCHVGFGCWCWCLSVVVAHDFKLEICTGRRQQGDMPKYDKVLTKVRRRFVMKGRRSRLSLGTQNCVTVSGWMMRLVRRKFIG